MNARKLSALVILGVAVVLALASGRRDPAVPSVGTPPNAGRSPVIAGGWIDDPDAVREVLDELNLGRFCLVFRTFSERRRAS